MLVESSHDNCEIQYKYFLENEKELFLCDRKVEESDEVVNR